MYLMGQFSIRVPEDLHEKARVLAAFKNLSLNEICVRAIQSFINQWEDDYGKIPLSPENIRM